MFGSEYDPDRIRTDVLSADEGGCAGDALEATRSDYNWPDPCLSSGYVRPFRALNRDGGPVIESKQIFPL